MNPRTTIARLVAVLALLFAAAASASAASRTYAELTGDVRNPERGFWRFLSEDFSRVTNGELRDAAGDGLTVGYGVVRLDDYRGRDLDGAILGRLDRAFAKARAAGVKVILRFAYNYPEDEQSYRNAKDAPLARVKRHIQQLGPAIAANADVILVLQAGFIGAWGEGHSSSNGLDKPGPKAAIRDALLAILPADRLLQWRYPPDVIRWSKTPPAAGSLGRIGIHNDCFLSSPTDVGTYASGAAARKRQRAYTMKLSRATLFSGETCAANPSKIRSSCGDILREGRQFHLTSLNLDYYRRFILRWKADGCFDEVARRMGHRLVLTRAEAPDAATRGGVATVAVTLRNSGWARLYNPRPLQLVARHVGSGRSFRVEFGGDLRSVEPELAKGKSFRARWSIPADAPLGDYRLFVAAPDGSSTLRSKPVFALRFANRGGKGAGWNGRTGRFALGLTIKVEAAP